MNQKMNNRYLVGMLLGVATILLSSCTKNFEIGFEKNDGEVALQFTKKFLWIEEPYPVCVLTVDIIERPSGKTVWSVKAIKDKCAIMTGLTIGSPPAGYEEEISKLPLIPGKTYEAGVIGGDGKVSASAPWELR